VIVRAAAASPTHVAAPRPASPALQSEESLESPAINDTSGNPQCGDSEPTRVDDRCGVSLDAALLRAKLAQWAAEPRTEPKARILAAATPTAGAGKARVACHTPRRAAVAHRGPRSGAATPKTDDRKVAHAELRSPSANAPRAEAPAHHAVELRSPPPSAPRAETPVQDSVELGSPPPSAQRAETTVHHAMEFRSPPPCAPRADAAARELVLGSLLISCCSSAGLPPSEKLYDEEWWRRHLDERRQGGAPPDHLFKVSGSSSSSPCQLQSLRDLPPSPRRPPRREDALYQLVGGRRGARH